MAELLQGSVDVELAGGVLVVGGWVVLDEDGGVVSRVVDRVSGALVEWLVGGVKEGRDRVELELDGGGLVPDSVVWEDPDRGWVLDAPSLGWVRTGIVVVPDAGGCPETTGCTGSTVVP